MKLDFILTADQQALVEENLSLIDKTISLFIDPDEKVCDLSRSDLYQEGAIALCKASATYDGKSAQFSTYATTVIRNHLYNCCTLGEKQFLPWLPLLGWSLCWSRAIS